MIAHTNLYWEYHTAPGRTAGTVTTADLDFAEPVPAAADEAADEAAGEAAPVPNSGESADRRTGAPGVPGQ